MTERIRFWLFILFCLVSTHLFAATSQYWISFTGPTVQRPGGGSFGGPKYLLKIDGSGNVLISPHIVLPNSPNYQSASFGATAIFENGKLLHLWAPDNTASHNLFHAVIERDSVKLLALHRTPIQVANPYNVQVSQKTLNNFLALEMFKDQNRHYTGVPLSPAGTLLLGVVDLVSGYGTCCGTGLSSDGRIFFFEAGKESLHVDFMLQRLTADGHPTGKPAAIARGSLRPCDMTNVLPGNRRFALYQAHVYNPTLVLQPIKAGNLVNLNTPINITRPRDSDWGNQTAVIDPDGTFVIYKLGGGSNLLVFQPLDELGHPSGQSKIIARNVGSGLDIAESTVK